MKIRYSAVKCMKIVNFIEGSFFGLFSGFKFNFCMNSGSFLSKIDEWKNCLLEH